MKAWHASLAVLAAAIGAGVCWHLITPSPTVLTFRIGQPSEDVVKNSTFPVMQHSITPTEDPMHLQAGETFVTEPAVVLKFDDPQHGFTLPPTKFAVLGYMHNTVDTLSTSPMMDKLPFDEAVAVLENLQNQFKAGSWTPWEGDDSKWFDLTADGKKRLYQRMFEPGYNQSAELRVPNKYSITLRLKCAEGCWTREPPYRFLVDVGVGHDGHAWWDKEPKK